MGAGLSRWIRQEVGKGYSKDYIRAHLVKRGYDLREVDRAFEHLDYSEKPEKRNLRYLIISALVIITIVSVVLVFLWPAASSDNADFSEDVPEKADGIKGAPNDTIGVQNETLAVMDDEMMDDGSNSKPLNVSKDNFQNISLNATSNETFNDSINATINLSSNVTVVPKGIDRGEINITLSSGKVSYMVNETVNITKEISYEEDFRALFYEGNFRDGFMHGVESVYVGNLSENDYSKIRAFRIYEDYGDRDRDFFYEEGTYRYEFEIYDCELIDCLNFTMIEYRTINETPIVSKNYSVKVSGGPELEDCIDDSDCEGTCEFCRTGDGYCKDSLCADCIVNIDCKKGGFCINNTCIPECEYDDECDDDKNETFNFCVDNSCKTFFTDPNATA